MGGKLNRDSIIREAKAIIADLVEKLPDTIETDIDFYDLGLSSITIIDFVELLNARLEISLGVESVFDYHGISSLADFILKEQGIVQQDDEMDIEVGTEELDALEIAIVGISGRFGEAGNLKEFWEKLSEQTPFEQYHKEDRKKDGENLSGFLKNRDCFDAQFFGINDEEADKMDPQQRVFMETAYHALEDAGYPAETLSEKRVAIFVGGRASDYKENISLKDRNYDAFLGNETSSIPTRFSYLYNLKAPSVCLDTACSSSIISLHYASQSLRMGECDLALAGGVYVDAQLNYYNMAKNSGLISERGKCKSLDRAADGMTLSEGAGVVVLKRLSDAVEDGDMIYAVIKGSAVTQSGRTNGFGIPSMGSQKELLKKAYENADINPGTISYIEANGTATKLGDAIELNALKDFFGKHMREDRKIAVGTSKTSVGHAVMASGMSGLLKILLAFQKGVMPATAGFHDINENVKLEKSPLYIAKEKFSFSEREEEPLRAAISSFGLNGTNVHMIFEHRAVEQIQEEMKRPCYIFPISAQSETSLRKKLEEFKVWLKENKKKYSPIHVSNVLCEQRSHFNIRCSFVAKDLDDLSRQLNNISMTSKKHINVTVKRKITASMMEKIQILWRKLEAMRDASEYKKSMKDLQSYYLQGYTFPFKELFGRSTFVPIPVMLYPFEEVHHWIDKQEDEIELGETIKMIYPEKVPSIVFGLNIQERVPSLKFEQIEKNRGLQMNGFEDNICDILYYQLASIGLFDSKTVSMDEIEEREDIASDYHQWLEESLCVLARNKYLLQEGKVFKVGNKLIKKDETIRKEWVAKKSSLKNLDDVRPQIQLLETVLKSLSDILLQKKSATDVMFPNSSMELVADIYKNNLVADYFNEVLAESIVSAVESRIAKGIAEPVRILEIGAGTGGTSEFVLKKLEPYSEHIAEYCYTDISKAFLVYGKENYGKDYPFLSFKLLNVEEAYSSYQTGMNQYDFVIASNVLHATESILQTLSNVKVLLRKNGILLLNELSSKSLFTHVTFGLLDGWWRPKDRDYRVEGAPAILPETWKEIFYKTGYTKTIFPAESAHELGQQIILAESNGIITVKEDDMVEKTSEKIQKQLKQEARLSADEEADFVKSVLIKKVAKELAVDESEVSDIVPLREMGIDSILSVALIQEINDVFQLEFNTTVLFDYVTIEQLSDYICEDYLEHVAKKIQDNSLELKEARQDTAISKAKDIAKDTAKYEDIAIIGFSGRFGNCDTAEEFWKLLDDGRDAITPVTRWDLSKQKNKKSFEKAALLNDIDKFDPLFFNISGKEAKYMDPQQRIFIEESWKAIEQAGYSGSVSNGLSCGVYVACGNSDYLNMYHEELPGQTFWGNMTSVTSARIAYYLNLKGPAITLDTACSSSLVAIHMACQGLWCNEINMALAGGISVQCSPNLILSEERVGMLSPDAKCYTFDDRANGFAYGEGAGVVVLKRLSNAIQDNDTIYGVIKGSGINQDGATNGLTAPSAKSQEKLIRDVYEKFDINPDEIQMVEAHGTGTKLGDPIEFQAITKAFQAFTERNKYCAIGSVKTNIGHTQYAAGIASVIKVLLSMQHKKIPATLNFEKGNSGIDFENTPFYVNTNGVAWEPESGQVRQAAISSFGASGTNAHLVIAQGPEEEKIVHMKKASYLLVLSAKTEIQLNMQVEQFASYLKDKEEEELGDISFTSLMGRKHFNYRFACVVSSKIDMLEKLNLYLKGVQEKGVFSGKTQTSKSADKKLGEDAITACVNDVDYVNNLNLLARYFVEGYELSYERLFDKNTYKRIPMPSYPFAKESYWKDAEQPTSEIKTESATKKCIKCFTEKWCEEQAVMGETVPSELLCLVQDKTQQDAMERIFQEKSADVRLIFVQRDNYTGRKEDYIEILNQVKKQYKKISAIVHTWFIDDERGVADCLRLSYFVQAIEETGLLVNKILYPAVYKDDFGKSIVDAVNGIGLSLKTVNPDITVCVIGENSNDRIDAVDWQEWAQRIWTETCCMENRPVSYQDGKRFTVKLEESVSEQGESLIRECGVYFVTGGTGKLLSFLEMELASRYHANLILMGRKDQDQNIESHLESLKSLGGQAIYVKGDVCNKTDVEHAMLVGKKEFGQINGVIHGAGIQGEGSVLEKTEKAMLEVLAPKITGAKILEEVFLAETLDFYCFVSSVSAVIGDFGGCDYAMANRFLLAYAKHRNEVSHVKHFAIGWPMWKEGNMGIADEAGRKMYLATSGLSELETKEGTDLWLQLLCKTDKTEQLVFAGDSQGMDRIVERADVLGRNKVFEKAGNRTEMLKKVNHIHESRWDIINSLRTMASELLDIPENRIEQQNNLNEYGFDSLSLVDYAKAIHERYQIPFTPSLFYSYATLENIADYLVAEYGQAVYEETSISVVHKTKMENKTEHIPAEKESNHEEQIAIIGMSGRFPQARTPKELWEILEQGKSVVTIAPSDRFTGEREKIEKWKCGWVPGVSEFEPLFFEISPKEAQMMDPRHRLLMQETWNALEDAGCSMSVLKEQTVGMFVGAESSDYTRYESGWDTPITSDHEAVLSSRIAYFMDLKGPNMTINTACSSGLVAMHQACQSIKNGECDMAIASGVNLILDANSLERIDKAGMISDTNTCYAFDKRADGMVPAEAVVSIVLKSLSKAKRDGNPIYAVVKGSGINYDGRTNGITSPNGLSQQKLIEQVYTKNHINPEDITYIATHGTGTKLGDPIEVNALYDAFHKFTDKENYCAITSTKTNFGHAFAASGLLSVVALVESMQHKKIPASLNIEEENSFIKWDKSPFYVNKQLKDWDVSDGKSRIGAVSAFGMSGTNAHIVLEEYPLEKNTEVDNAPIILALSAKREDSLEQKVIQLKAFLQETNQSLSCISHTLLAGRTHFEHRVAFVTETKEDAVKLIDKYLSEQDDININHGVIDNEFRINAITTNFIQELTKKAGMLVSSKSEYMDSLRALSNLYCMGYVPLQEQEFEHVNLIHMPTYPFQRDKYWIEKAKPEARYSANVTKTFEEPLVKTVMEVEKTEDLLVKKEEPVVESKEKTIEIAELSRDLSKSLADALYVDLDEVNEKKRFIELGLDSIMGIEWIKMVNTKYHLNIGATKIYDYPSIEKFAPYVHSLITSNKGVQKQSVSVQTENIEKPPVTTTKESRPNNQQVAQKEDRDVQVKSKVKANIKGKDDIEAELLKSLEDALYVSLEEADKKKNFIELGLDSIIGIEWIKDINTMYGLNIPASKMYDYPNIKKFAGMIEEKLKDSTETSPVVERIELEQEEQLSPEMLGNPLFQERYHSRLSYYAGSMANGVSSVEMVKKMANASILSIFGSGGYSIETLEEKLAELKSSIKSGSPYGVCYIASINDERKELEQAKLFVEAQVPVVEVAACTSITKSLVYLRLKGMYFDDQEKTIKFPRRLIGKCSRIEVAKQFMSYPPKEYVDELVREGMLTEKEALIASKVSMVDDIAVEADSGGHTDQAKMELIVPQIIGLRDSLVKKYQYQDDIMIGCGGGIGSAKAVADAFALGADFILTGSINQCTFESGASEVVKDILCGLDEDETGYAIAGDMFEIGAKVQVVAKQSKFIERANTLYEMFMEYDSLEEIPEDKKKEIEENYFKKSFSDVWKEIEKYKQRRNPKDLEEASTNKRFKMALFIKWYHAHCNKMTLEGNVEESDNFEIFCGPAMGLLNKELKGTKLEHWQDRHVDEIAQLLMEKACVYMVKNGYLRKQINLSSIAIVGMSANFPKAENVNEYWNNLVSGRDCVSEITDERWDIKKYFNPDKEHKGTYLCNKMGVLEDIDKFDAELFQIPPVEAIKMDPQQRKFLENCWLCIEDAGIKPSNMEDRKCSVFVGCGSSGYKSMIEEEDLDSKVLTGNVSSTLAARISYLLNLKGASISIETACSSSLVAVAQACDSLVLHNCDYALAGGAGIVAEPSLLIMSSKAGMLSEDGACYTFDQRANGFVPGEGVGVVMLKRLGDAIADNDRIYGVIKGWGVNQDGKTNGITAPSVISQTQLEKEVYEKFHINPEDITYVEAHGTGTKLGDPIEVEALTESFRAFTDKKNYCAIGSVKSNIGHLMAAAGIASLIKVLLSMKHKTIPPTIHYEKLNEHIDLHNSPFYVADKLQKWEVPNKKLRCAAISAFGFSGTNCHLVVEEYPQKNNSKEELDGCGLFVLSAQSESQLKQYCRRMSHFLKEEKKVVLSNVLFTLQTAREDLEEKIAFVISDKESLIAKLDGFVEGKDVERIQVDNSVPFEKADELLEIAKKWMNGAVIDWNAYYEGEKVRLVSITTYPFRKNSYWIRKKNQLPKEQLVVAEKLSLSDTEVKEESDSKIQLVQDVFIVEEEVENEKLLLDNNDVVSQNWDKEESTKSTIELEVKEEEKSDQSLLDRLLESLSEVLYIDKSSIVITKEFSDMGIDSILGIEWIKKINKMFRSNFNATMLYEYTTVKELEKYIAQTLSTQSPVIKNEEPEQIKEIDSDSSTKQKLRDTLAECMYMEPDEINMSKNFMDMGLDSILGIEWIGKIKKKYGWDIDITVLYDYPTVVELASYIDSEVIVKNEKEESEMLELDQLLENVFTGKLNLSDAEESLGKINLD